MNTGDRFQRYDGTVFKLWAWGNDCKTYETTVVLIEDVSFAVFRDQVQDGVQVLTLLASSLATPDLIWIDDPTAEGLPRRQVLSFQKVS